MFGLFGHRFEPFLRALDFKLGTTNEPSASRGVKTKAETESVIGLKAESKNPSKDLPNQEKNQY